MAEYYVNPSVRDCERVFPEQGRYGFYRYDMNENPEGLPVEFVESVLGEITPEFLAVYPEPDRFLQKYAVHAGVPRENLVATNGSDMAIRYILEVFCERGREVLTVTPSFEMYAVNCSILGLVHRAVEYNADFSMDVGRIVEAITEETDVVVLLNPNNPVGNVYTEEEFEAVAGKAEECGAVVVVDEAYHYFCRQTFMHHVLEKKNVIVLRTFSKLFSLAGCRLGVLAGSAELAGYVRKSRLTFDANAVALLFAERLLDHPEVVEGLVRDADEGKAYALGEFRRAGYEVRDCQGNFILVRPNRPPEELARRLRERHRVLVKTYRNELLGGYIRVSTGPVGAMRRLAECFLEEDAGPQ